jgi:hypothetical protein
MVTTFHSKSLMITAAPEECIRPAFNSSKAAILIAGQVNDDGNEN